MRLERLRREELDGRRRVAADVVWESADRAPQVLSFEAAYPAAEDLEASANAFALAALPFAVWSGERRLRVDGTLCPRLRDGLEAAMAIYARWYPHCRPVMVEPNGGYRAVQPRASARTAVFLSGGVDALTALRCNRRDYPRDHAASIAEALLLFGTNDFEFSATGPEPARLAVFHELEARLRSLGSEEGFALVPIHTTVRLLCPGYACWTAIGYGAATVAVAHALPRRFTTVLFASDGGGVDPPPGGSHPLLDQHFSSSAVQVEHVQAAMCRLDKLRLLAEWPTAMRIVQPCHRVRVLEPGQINCGRCEKCVRTMLGFVALGKLREATAFAEDDVTPAMVAAIPVHTAGKAALLAELIAPLEEAGRHDLSRALRRRLRRWRWWQR